MDVLAWGSSCQPGGVEIVDMTTKTLHRPISARGAPTGPAVLALVLVTIAWGSSFVITKSVLAQMPIADFLALRFLIAAIVVLAISPSAVGRLSPTERRRAILLGLLYGSAQLLQGVGLETTSASVSGFVSGMYVVMTPLLAAAVLRQHVSRNAWVATGLASVGLGLLALNGLSIGGGELVTLASALAFAAHILATGRWSTGGNFLGLAIVQLFTVSAVCGLFAAPDGIAVPPTSGVWLALLYMALVTGALALVVQTWAQSRIDSTRAAVVMTMEPVFAAAFAVGFGGDTLGPRALVGALFVLGAMYLVERSPSAGTEVERSPWAGTDEDVVEDPAVRSTLTAHGSVRSGRKDGHSASGERATTRPPGAGRPTQAHYRRRRLRLEREWELSD
jgi:drug/metabolite transporter (DMT)-like permease